MNTFDSRFVSTLDVIRFLRLPDPRSNKVWSSINMHGQARFALTAEPPEPKMVSFKKDHSKDRICVPSLTIKLDWLTRYNKPLYCARR